MYCLFLGSMRKILRILSTQLKYRIASARWGTLKPTDLGASRPTSWKKVWMANYLRSSTGYFSGHYHTRSDDGRIFYLNNPYEMFWNDVNDTRGFTIFDTETLTHTPVNNPYKLFYNIYYEDTNHKLFNTTEYKNKIVKVIVRKKNQNKEFEKFIDKLYSAGVQDLKIIENFEIKESEEFEISEDENTLSILNRYIDESEFELDKNTIKGIFQDLYKQVCEVE